MRVSEKLDLVMKNGDLANCYPGCVNITSFCVEGESFMMALSPGSACTFASLQPTYSYMLNAMSAQDDMEEVVHYTLEKTVQEVRILRFNPTPSSPPFSYFSSLFTLSSSYSSGSSSLCSLCSSTSTGSSSLSSISP